MVDAFIANLFFLDNLAISSLLNPKSSLIIMFKSKSLGNFSKTSPFKSTQTFVFEFFNISKSHNNLSIFSSFRG